MQRKRMTNKDVERFPVSPEDKAKSHPVLWDGGDGSVKGFGMRYSAASGARTYILQFRVRGSKQERQISIGRHSEAMRVEEARELAGELRKQMERGIDPVVDRKRKEEERRTNEKRDSALAATLQQMLDLYLEHKRTKNKKPLRPATKSDMRRSIEVNLKDWLQTPVATITRDMCYARFLEITKRAPAAANLTFAYLRSVLNYAAEHFADEQGNFTILATNPVARALKKAGGLNEEEVRTRRIPLARVGHGWLALQRLRASAKTPVDRTRADLVSLRMMTALRLSESGSLRWSQIDLENKVIRLSSDVGKTHQSVVLPMSDVLFNILDERAKLPRKGPNAREYVFPSRKQNGKTPWMMDPAAAMDALAAATGCMEKDEKTGEMKPALSSHDFRRTLEDVAKAVKIGDDDRRKLLVHKPTDVHGKHYDNSPDPEALRPAVNAIAKYIVDAATVAEAQETASNVVAFPARA